MPEQIPMMDAPTLRDLQAVIRRRYRGTQGIDVRMSPDGTTVIFSLVGTGPSAPPLSLVPITKAVRNAVNVTGSGAQQDYTGIDQVPTLTAPHLITMDFSFTISGLSSATGSLLAGYYDVTASGSHLSLTPFIQMSGSYSSGYAPMLTQTFVSGTLTAGHTYRPWFSFGSTFSGGAPQFQVASASWTITPIGTP